MAETEAKTTLITGATRGIGRAIAERLARTGHAVIGVARSPDASFPGRLYTADLADAAAADAVLAEITARHEVDHLVNNAGFNEPQRLGAVKLADFETIIDLNLRAALQCAQACLPAMLAKGRGRIVNIASRALLGRDAMTSYAAAKAGLVAMTRCWAIELAARNITVNAVAPGPIETELFRRNNPPDTPRTKQLLGRIPMGRLGRPEEVAAAVSYFLSDEAGFTTGQTLYVCGGLSVGVAPA